MKGKARTDIIRPPRALELRPVLARILRPQTKEPQWKNDCISCKNRKRLGMVYIHKNYPFFLLVWLKNQRRSGFWSILLFLVFTSNGN
jgi:hypothetical protein